MRMNARSVRRLVARLSLTFVASAVLLAQTPQENAADAERVIKALDIKQGSIVGEIGAGGGELTILIAKAVGPDGRVFSNELNGDRLRAIGVATAAAGLTNVTLVEGKEADANLPEACCHAIFMRNVYHHFEDPPAMNASLLKALKPGGKLAVMDFGPPPGAEAETPAGRSKDGHHGVTAPTVERELKAAGFEIASAIEHGFRGVFVVAGKSATPD